MLNISRWPGPKAFQNNLLLIVGRYTKSSGSADLTKSAGGRGITSITNRATGKFRVNFPEVPAGSFIGLWGSIGNDADTAADSKVVSYIAGSYDAANKRVDFDIVDLGATPGLSDLTTTEELAIFILFAETAQP